MADQQFCLRWNNHQSTLISVFDTLLENGTLVDCTLAAEGQYLKAHKVVLCACSPYLETLLSQHYEKHPIVILKDVKFSELKSMMDYMYRGEVNISQDQLGTFLKAAESLQIKGLSDNGADGDARDVGSTSKVPQRKPNQSVTTTRPTDSAPESPAHRSRDGSISPTSRKRRRIRRNSQGDDSNVGDSHLDTSNSCDLPSQAQIPIVPNIPASVTSSITTTPIMKTPIIKPEQTEIVNRLDSSNINSLPPPESGLLKEKIEPSEPLLEPKTEYLEDVNTEDSVEDLTLDDDDEMDGMDISNMSSMSNMSRPGPSHGNDLSNISNQGFAPWQLGGNQSGTDEVFMAAQEAVSAHRDSQGNSTLSPQDGMKNKINTLCNECGSIIMYSGVVLHLDSCKMAKESDEALKQVLKNGSSFKGGENQTKPLGSCIDEKIYKKTKSKYVDRNCFKGEKMETLRLRKENRKKNISSNKYADGNHIQDSSKQCLPGHSDKNEKEFKNQCSDKNKHTWKCSCTECSNLSKLLQDEEDVNLCSLSYHPYSRKGPATCDCGKVCESNRGLVTHLKYCRRNPNRKSTPDNVNKNEGKRGVKRPRETKTKEVVETSSAVNLICPDSNSKPDVVNTRNDCYVKFTATDEKDSLRPSTRVPHTVSNLTPEDVGSENDKSRVEQTEISIDTQRVDTSAITPVSISDSNLSTPVDVTTLSSLVNATTQGDGGKNGSFEIDFPSPDVSLLDNSYSSIAKDRVNSTTSLKSVGSSSVTISSRIRRETKAFNRVCRCGVICRSEYAYQRHKAFYCTKLKFKKLKCNWCSFLTGNSSGLRNHLAMKHKDVISKILSSEEL